MKSRLLLLFVLLFGANGCAFAGIGAGIGAAIPKTEQVSHPEADATSIVLVHNDDDALVRAGSEQVTEVRKRKGNHWLTGFLVGGAVDLVVGSVLAVLAVQGFGSGLSAMGGM